MFFGHGGTLSKKCVESFNFKFPEVVSEDHSITVDIVNKGFTVANAPLVHFFSESPANFQFYKLRTCKFVGGDLQFLKNYF
jgi:hypothetical protein